MGKMLKFGHMTISHPTNYFDLLMLNNLLLELKQLMYHMNSKTSRMNLCHTMLGMGAPLVNIILKNQNYSVSMPIQIKACLCYQYFDLVDVIKIKAVSFDLWIYGHLAQVCIYLHSCINVYYVHIHTHDKISPPSKRLYSSIPKSC